MKNAARGDRATFCLKQAYLEQAYLAISSRRED
jgi:hypothetical protein